ncbi:MAG: hypothetical protein PHG69_02490 [Candidatus Omnitrophica bacterium]|nr:hypothetical protein [Candidatus Omnitrophota bacterium]
MLYLLSIILSAVLLFNPVTAYAGFFEENKPVEVGGCSECKSELPNVNPGVEKKVAEIERAIAGKFDKKENTNNEIIFFISLTNSSFEAVFDTLSKFQKDNPDWKIKGVITGSLRNLKQSLLQKQKLFSYGVEFNIDISGSLAKDFDITKTPSYVIIYHGNHYKTLLQPDLNELLGSLTKIK